MLKRTNVLRFTRPFISDMKPQVAAVRQLTYFDRLTVCPIRGVRTRRMGYANPAIPQRPDRRAMGARRAVDPCVPRRPAAQDLDARRPRRDLLRPADRLPVALPPQGLPAPEPRLGLLRRVAAPRHPGHPPRPLARPRPQAGEARTAAPHR